METQLNGKILVISDIHGNFIALEETVNYMQSILIPDYWCVLGDTIGYFPDGNNVLKLLKTLKPICIKGNHEEMLLSGNYRMKNNYYRLKEQLLILNPLYLEWIKTWPEYLSINLGQFKALFVHGSPDNFLDGYIYQNSDLSKINFGDNDLIFCGHTHRPFVHKFNDKLILNVGSVGLPRDGSHYSNAVLFNTYSLKCDYYSIPIDIKKIKKLYSHQVHKDIINIVKVGKVSKLFN